MVERPANTDSSAPLEAGVRERVQAAVRAVLAGNRRRGVAPWSGSPWDHPIDGPPSVPGGDHLQYDFVCPSPSAYPFQWLWDSCFHAIALTHVDQRLAEQELLCLLQGQRADGFLPHILLWERERHAEAVARYSISLGGRYTTATSPPPVLGLAVERVYQARRGRAFLARALPALAAFHDWLAATRDPDGAGLIAIVQPDESGLDASPKYDQLLPLAQPDDPSLRRGMRRLIDAYAGLWDRPADLLAAAAEHFLWVDCLVNSLYLASLASEARLWRVADNPARATEVERRRSIALDSLLSRCWDPERGAFFDYSLDPSPEPSGPLLRRPARLLTIASLLPLILPDLPRPIAAQLVERHLLEPDEFWLPYPVPSVAASEPTFEPDFRSGLIWRGPTWINTNWLLVHALRAHGYPAVAAELITRTCAMADRGGIREFFDPYTGAGLGAEQFGWSCLVLDL